MAAHERLSADKEVKLGSDRSFGLVFTVVFAVIGAFPLIHGLPPRVWALGIAAGFLLVSLVRPRSLRPLNLLWFKFGLLLHGIVNPVIMGLLFFVTVTPMALALRLLGKDPLKRRLEPAATSYWIIRQPPGPAPESMKNQF